MRTILFSALPALVISNAFAGTADDLLKTSGVKGGLIVVIGCDDADLITGLHASDAYLVHALDTDQTKVDQVREAIEAKGLYGNVSAMRLASKALPYADNLVNLIAVADAGCRVSREEIERVLAPRGVLLDFTDQSDPSSRQYTKPVPSDIDDWTHYLHSPNNHAVAQDTVVAVPAHYQWIGEPRFSRSHDHLSSISAVVSAKGRVFSIVDEGPISFAAASPRWKLVARDAFNGIRLWEHGIEKWEYHLRDFRSGPADIARRLVAVGDTVYVTLGYGEPVAALDAATGEVIRTYKGTEGTREILVDGDTLYLVIGKPHESWGADEAREIVRRDDYCPPFRRLTPPARDMKIACLSASTGKLRWVSEESYTRALMPATLTLSDGRVFFHNLDELVCLDARSGMLQWKANRPIQRKRLAWSSPTVVAYDGMVYAADRAAEDTEGDLLWLPSGGYHEYIRGEGAKGKLIAYDMKDGRRVWECPAYEGFNSAVDIFIIDGLLWTGRYAWSGDPGINQGRDPKTGEVKVKRGAYPMRGHARCHRAKATSKYLIVPGRSVEMIDVESGKRDANGFIRGNCAYGIMPANGLIYVPPHSCACGVNDLLKDGFVALAAQGKGNTPQPTGDRLVKGPSYTASPSTRDSRLVTGDSWPTYRGNAARLGSTGADVPANLKETWRTRIGGVLTPPVSAGGIVLVAAKQRHTVYALDSASGKQLWTFTAGARIDSPPTIFDSGLAAQCLFGSRDGYVYCLRLSDGELAWRFCAAPSDKLISVDGQLESAWPVPGSVLVDGGIAYFVAGRNTHLDGGMVLYKVDAAKGAMIKAEELKDTSLLPDVLAADDQWVFMRGAVFTRDLQRQKKPITRLWSSVGFLDHSWWHRTYWLYGGTISGGFGGWHRSTEAMPTGRILVTDGSRIYGYGRTNYDSSGGHVGLDGRHDWGPIKSPFTSYRLFGRKLEGNRSEYLWARDSNVVGQALVLAGKTLFVAGPANPLAEIPRDPSAAYALVEALESDRGGKLLCVSATDGKTIASHELRSSPVFDGMIAAQGRLYLSTKSGEIICME